MAKHDLTSLEFLRNLVAYDPDTGFFFWKERPASMFRTQRRAPEKVAAAWNRKHAGKRAGILNGDGYVQLRVAEATCKAHRAAWALSYGEWPAAEIDHINHDRADNRIANLRAVDTRQNALNQSRPRNNKSGVMGVSWSAGKGKWAAHIMVRKKQISLGTYSNLDDAVRARRLAEARYGFHPNHGASRPRTIAETGGMG